MGILAETRRVFPADEIFEDLELARGAPAAYTAAVAFALGRLAGLQDGQVTLTDDTIVVAGTASDAEALEDARLAFSTGVPAGVTLGPIEILPARAARFVWSAAVDAARITLFGFIPNDVARGIVAGTVGDAFPDYELVDQTIVASGEPDGFLEAVEFAVDALTRLESGGVTLDELTLDVAGVAKTVDDYEVILDKVGAPLPAGMQLVAADVLPATVADYGFSGSIGGEGVELAGFVPSQEDLQEVTEAANTLFGEQSVTNAIRVARGGPAIDWNGAVRFGLAELAKLQSGDMAISGNAAYRIMGVARSSATYAEIDQVVSGTLPASLALESAAVTPPPVEPFRLRVAKRGMTVTINGHFDSRQTRDAFTEAARRMFAGQSIVDETAFASGAADGFFDAARLALASLAGMTGGHIAVAAGQVDVVGFVSRAAVRDRSETFMRERLPDGFTLVSRLSVRQPVQRLAAEPCSSKLTGILAIGRLDFTEESQLSAESLPVLDRIAATMARCPEVLVEVGVHSDSDGSRSANRRRTQARAETIVEYLVDAAVRRERLTATGFGESDPIADNSTPAGKARNRRIAFAVAVADPVEPLADVPVPTPPAVPEPAVTPIVGAGATGGDESPAASADEAAQAADTETTPGGAAAEGSSN